MDDPCSLNCAFPGKYVEIEADDGKITKGEIKRVLGASSYVFAGIKVELVNGKVGRIQKYLEPASKNNNNPREKEFREQINYPEGQCLEFKASFLFDLKKYEHTQEVDTSYDVVHSIAKTIAAFANSYGGLLYVGVRDKDRKILGLENDYTLIKKYKNGKHKKILKHQNREIKVSFLNEEFLTALKNTMFQFMNKDDYLQCVLPEMLRLEEGDICVIKVKRSTSPLILNDSEYEFYVRSGDQSEQYDNISRFCEYWCAHTSEHLEPITQ